MPYKDPERQKAAKRESARRAKVRRAGEGTERVIAEAESAVPRVLPDPPGRDELLRLLGVQARSGSVRAVELLLRMEVADAGDDKRDPLSGLDDLASRRAVRA
jgi:hypothetical protein